MQRVLIATLILAAVAGFSFGIVGLAQAHAERQTTAGLDGGLLSELEYKAQESRSAFLSSLTTADPSRSQRYAARSLASSRSMEDTLWQLRSLPLDLLAGGLRDLDHSWKEYGELHDEPAFLSVLERLQTLRITLERDQGVRTRVMDETLRQSLSGLAVFTLSIMPLGVLLRKANASKRAEALDNSRCAPVLEMLSAHVPLPETLRAIAQIAPQSNGACGAAIWTRSGGYLQLQAAANVPDEFASIWQRFPLLNLDRRSGLIPSAPKALYDATGGLLGVLQVYGGEERHSVSQEVYRQMATLAAVAMDDAQLRERLAFQAQHDRLTGLPNRPLFHDRVQQAMLLAARQGDKAGVISIDLDRFQYWNETVEPRIGDELLAEIGRRLRGCLRESDTVARVGENEFAVLTQNLDDAAGGEAVCIRIMKAMAKPLSPAGQVVTVSAGISLFPDHGDDSSTLLRNANLAMHTAKGKGGNTYHLFDAELGHSIERRIRIERELKLALERNEFSLVYQPLVQRDGALQGLEALLRWNSRALGPVAPADFIPVSEELGLISRIGEWVTRTACRDGARLLEAGFEVPRIAVNVSPKQFLEKNFVETVQSALDEHRYSPSRLELEITETGLMNNLSGVVEQIESLRRLGVRFAIDDFGMGYSSLNHLRTLPVDSIKIDRSFIQDLGQAENGSSAVVRGIISLAHDLQLEVVAEGVETNEQLLLLRRWGCDIHQGFFLYRPMPLEAVERLLQARQGTTETIAVETKGVADSLVPCPSKA